MEQMYSNCTHIVYLGSAQEFLYERPVLKSSKIANEFLAMQYGDFIDEGDEVKLSLFDNETIKDSDLLSEIAEIVCVQFSDEPSSLNADYSTTTDQLKIIALNVEPEVKFIKLQTRDKDDNVLKESDPPIDLLHFKEVNKLIFIIDSSTQIKNLSPIIHEFSNTPHNDILDKVITLKSLNKTMQMVVIDGTFNNQADLSLGDELIDYEIKVTPSWSTYDDKLLINGMEVNG